MSGRLIRVLAGSVAAIVAAAGIALATIPSSNGVIHGCYQKNSGNLRLVDAPADCRAPEIAVSWNQKGEPGGQGPQGQQGAAGKDGASVTSAALTEGDANCAFGGSS